VRKPARCAVRGALGIESLHQLISIQGNRIGTAFDLLADPEGELAAAFDVEQRQGAAARTTVVLADGELKRVYEDVSPDGHAREVLGDLLDDGLAQLQETE
jgi:predicted regulator of amino acid metabolism with ACT domain